MKKKIFEFILAICLILPCMFTISACDDDITDCAYVQFVPSVDGEYVRYSAMMESSYTHVYLLESETVTDWEHNYLIKISFKRNLGVDYEIDEKDTLVVDIEDWYYMEIRIKKEYYYDSKDSTNPKKIYLNGEDITSKADSTLSAHPEKGSHDLGEFWHDGVYYFEDFGLVKGNTSEFINTIEYK